MSTMHISDDLPRLLTGDATRDEVMVAAEHLRTCIDCQQELVSATIAHASLASAQRFAAEVVAPRADDLETIELPTATDLPDLSAVFAQVRQDAATDAVAVTTKPRLSRTRFAVAAAVAGLLIGGGGAIAATQLGSSSSPAGRSVALAAFGEGTHAATARIASGKLTINASSLPVPDAEHRYEVWLTNPARTQMQPVGWIGTDGKATLTVPQDLTQTFSAIEVSVQRVDAPRYEFSGVSVLRGSYTA